MKKIPELNLIWFCFKIIFRIGKQPPPTYEPTSPINLDGHNEVGHGGHHRHHHHESFSSTRSGQILWIRGLTRLQTQVGPPISQLFPLYFPSIFFFHFFLDFNCNNYCCWYIIDDEKEYLLEILEKVDLYRPLIFFMGYNNFSFPTYLLNLIFA